MNHAQRRVARRFALTLPDEVAELYHAIGGSLWRLHSVGEHGDVAVFAVEVAERGDGVTPGQPVEVLIRWRVCAYAPALRSAVLLDAPDAVERQDAALRWRLAVEGLPGAAGRALSVAVRRFPEASDAAAVAGAVALFAVLWSIVP